MTYYAVIDTNVFISALLSKAAHKKIHTQNIVFDTNFANMKKQKADIMIRLCLHIPKKRKEVEKLMKIAVCDDDKAAREHIVSLIKEQAQDAEIKVFATGEEMLRAGISFDISFLDVEMNVVSGMDVAEHIRQMEQESSKSIIIFVTGYGKYMNSAFDVLAFHYLLKPINEEKFRKVFSRALKELRTNGERTKRYILIRNSGVQQKVYIPSFLFVLESLVLSLVFALMRVRNMREKDITQGKV